MITVINYADTSFQKKQKLNSLTAKFLGGAKKVIEYSPKDIDDEFRKKYSHILCQKTGGGYWIWKPYIILKTLNKMKEGEHLFYCDSGATFLKSLHPFLKEFERLQQPILGFEIPLIEKQWTKRDASVILKVDDKRFLETQQICAGYIFIQKCDKAIKFFQEFMDYAVDERVITNIPNQLSLPNDPSFIDHRHDQSLFSLLFKKNGYVPLPDPSDFGHFPEAFCQKEGYLFVDRLQINPYASSILSNRKTNPFVYTAKYFVKRVIKKFFLSFYSKRFNPREVKFKIY
jgi:hypothetical protein